jgi:hypothetical protein
MKRSGYVVGLTRANNIIFMPESKDETKVVQYG